MNDLLGAMLAALQRLTVKQQELSVSDANVTEIAISVGPFTQGGTPFYGLDAYLDVSFEDGSSGVWFLTCWRDDSGWNVERDVTLRPAEGEDLERHLSKVPVSGSDELAAALPKLVDELLDVSLPEPPQREPCQAS